MSSHLTTDEALEKEDRIDEIKKQVAQRATIAHLSPMCQGQSAPKPYAAFPPPQ